MVQEKSTLFKVLFRRINPLGCKMNRLGELAYIPQLDEVTLQEERFCTCRQAWC